MSDVERSGDGYLCLEPAHFACHFVSEKRRIEVSLRLRRISFCDLGLKLTRSGLLIDYPGLV